MKLKTKFTGNELLNWLSGMSDEELMKQQDEVNTILNGTAFLCEEDQYKYYEAAKNGNK